jgi:hypothetical protein
MYVKVADSARSPISALRRMKVLFGLTSALDQNFGLTKAPNNSEKKRDHFLKDVPSILRLGLSVYPTSLLPFTPAKSIVFGIWDLDCSMLRITKTSLNAQQP